MDSFLRQLDKGLDSLAGKMDQLMSDRASGGLSEEGVGDVYIVNNARYRIIKKLAEGGFAFVFLAEQVETGRPVALKRIMVQDDEHMEIIKREINFLKLLNGKEGIIPFLGAASFRKGGRSEVIVLTEYCPRGSVLELMYQRERNRMTETELLFIFEIVCKAVYHMHSQDPPIAHRDLKVENVLVGKNGSLYLIDFGSASTVSYDTDKPHIRNIAENDINRNTTLLYRAPEMVDLYRKQVINEKVDIWSLGCMLFKMMYYTDPFDGKLGILNARYRVPDFPPYTPKMHDLLRFLLNPDPDKRPDICDVLEKLGTSVPRIKRRAQPSSSPSVASKEKRPAGTSDNGAAAKDLFSMLEWQKNDDSSVSSGSTSPMRKSAAREARGRATPPAASVAEALVVDFEQKANISSGESTKQNDPLDLFANFNQAPQREASPVTFPSTNDDGWGDFTTFETSAPSPAPALLGTDSLAGPSPTVSPAMAKKQPDKQDILSLYSASESATPATPSSYSSPVLQHPRPAYVSVMPSTMPGVGYPVMMAAPGVAMYTSPAVSVYGSAPASPIYARASSPLSAAPASAPSSISNRSPSPLTGQAPLMPMAVSSTPLTPSAGRPSLSASSPAPNASNGTSSDPFADLWKSASK